MRPRKRPWQRFSWARVDDHAAHFAEELAADESEIVVLALKILVEDHHLGKPQGQELHGINASFSLPSIRLPRPAVVGEVKARSSVPSLISNRPRKYTSLDGDGSVEIFVFLQILEISFHQRMKLLHLGDEQMFALDCSIDNLVEAAGGGAAC